MAHSTSIRTPAVPAHDHHATGYCNACRTAVVPRRNSPLWYAAAVLALFVYIPMMAFVAILPPINMMLIPPLFLTVIGLAGPLGEKLDRDPRCPACNKVTVAAGPR
jgi:hypothetical protein